MDTTVHNGAELQAALQAAKPGTAITLAPGDFGDVGLFELTVPEMTVRASVPHRSVLRAPFLVSGDRAKLVDLAFLGEGQDSIYMAAIAACADRLEIRTADVEVAGCDFGFFPGRAILVRPAGLRPYIHDCGFHDNTKGGGNVNAHEAIALGYDNKNSHTPMKGRVLGNKLWNLNVEDEAISVKTSDNYIAGNQLSSSKGSFSNRYGEGNLYQNNTSNTVGGIKICDRGNQLIGNKLSGKGQIRIIGGSQTIDSAGNGHPQAVDTYLSANSGTLVVGYNYSGDNLPAVNTRVASHSGSIQLKNHTGTQTP